MIEVQNIEKIYGEVYAARDVNFSAKDGEITTLLGANGSGKTTTLRCIAGLIKPTKGDAWIDGIAVSENPLKAREQLGFVADEFGLYGRMTAREHLVYFAGFHDLYGAEADAAAEKTIQILHMGEIADRRTEGFSLGERAKVALARALVYSPSNIILDEPTRGLDVMSIRLLRELLRELRSDGRTILFSSHIMAEVEDLADRVVMITDGRVVADGTPEELKQEASSHNLEEAFVTLTSIEGRAA